jgi:hypothetical protein
VINFKTLAIAAAVLSSVVFALPTSSQAMPQAAPVKIDAASNGNLIQVHSRRYCRYGRCYARYRYREYQRSYYDSCPPYYGYYLPHYGADRPCKSNYRPYYGYYRRPWLGF